MKVQIATIVLIIISLFVYVDFLPRITRDPSPQQPPYTSLAYSSVSSTHSNSVTSGQVFDQLHQMNQQQQQQRPLGAPTPMEILFQQNLQIKQQLLLQQQQQKLQKQHQQQTMQQQQQNVQQNMQQHQQQQQQEQQQQQLSQQMQGGKNVLFIIVSSIQQMLKLFKNLSQLFYEVTNFIEFASYCKKPSILLFIFPK